MIKHTDPGKMPSHSSGSSPGPLALSSDLYNQIRRMAHRYMSGERAGHTLQTTALINEAYLRLAPRDQIGGVDHRHFLCLFASAMREVLIDHARNRRAMKRGGGWERVPMQRVEMACGGPSLDLLALDEALHTLAARDPRMAQVVELRFFAGLTEAQTAAALELSPVTVRREWRIARMMLRRELEAPDRA